MARTVERIPHAPAAGERQLGDLVIGHLPGDGPRRLLIGHMDTVFDDGHGGGATVHGGRRPRPGPGRQRHEGRPAVPACMPSPPCTRVGERPAVTFVANPDEEIGSIFSGAHIRRLAPEHDVSLVLECARASGAIVSARKGIADLELTFTGRAAHAGVEPEKGRSAILAAARQVVALHELNGRWPGVTLNAGVIAGGTRPNVVPAECRIQLDLRAATADAFDAARAEVQRLVAGSPVEGVTSSVRELASHRPMEKTPATARLAELAVTIAGELGFELTDAATGGASDANTTAGLGVPTLDGLGPIGGDDHSADEWLDLASVVPRTTLLATLIARVGEAL